MRSVVSLFALSLCLVGCSAKGDDPEPLTKETLEIMNEQADVFEKSKSIAEATPKMQALEKRAAELLEKNKNLKIRKSDNDRIKEKYGPEIEKAAKRLAAARDAFADKHRGQIMQDMIGIRTEMASAYETAPDVKTMVAKALPLNQRIAELKTQSTVLKIDMKEGPDLKKATDRLISAKEAFEKKHPDAAQELKEALKAKP